MTSSSPPPSTTSNFNSLSSPSPPTTSKTDNIDTTTPSANGLVGGAETTTLPQSTAIPVLGGSQPPVDINPWRDDSPPISTIADNTAPSVLKTADPFDNDPSISGLQHQLNAATLGSVHIPNGGSQSSDARAGEVDAPIKPPIPGDVLQDFDPLISQEEKAARDAWENAESHPPPPPPTGKGLPHTPSPPTSKESPISSRSPSPSLARPQTPSRSQPAISTPTPVTATGTTAVMNSPTNPFASASFPSLAALARTFAIPGLGSPKPRPQSLDIARPIASPTTLSSLAAQQESRPSSRAGIIRVATPGQGQGSGGLMLGPSGGEAMNQVASGSSSGSGVASPVPSGSRGGNTDKGESFDFQKFLDQMKTKSAEPVAKYLRSFLANFAKRPWTVNDQVKIINEFLGFIAGHMRSCDVWKNANDQEFDNAMEGMEKLVMNRLYEYTFTPEVARSVPPRQITSDDLEKDRVLAQRTALFGWLEEKHLDIPEGDGSKGFMMFAQQELIKINHYKAPRDKLICVLNCCKVIFGLIRHLKKEEGADSFIPILIFVVLKANPEHLLSNVEFINRFRNPEKLQSEAGYYLSSLMGAVSFIETMDHTSLSNITQEEFEKNVEEAIQSLPDSSPMLPHATPIKILPSTPYTKPTNASASLLPSSITGVSGPNTPQASAPPSPRAGEEPATPLSLPAPSLSEDAKRLLQKTGDTISKPLNAIGRIFSEALDGAENKLNSLPGPFSPFESRPEQQQHSSAQHPPHWAHPDQIRQYAHLQNQETGSRSSSPAPLFGDRPYTPPLPQQIPTPYKPRVKRVPSPSVSSLYPGYFDSPTPPTRTAGGPSGPQTHQPLAMGPSQPVYGSLQLPSTPPPQHPSQFYSHSHHLSHQYQQSYTPQPGQPPLLPPRRNQSISYPYDHQPLSRTSTPGPGVDLVDLDIAGIQAQIDEAHAQTSAQNKETLWQIFPTVDKEIVDWVLEANDNDLGKSIEALLELSSGN
ncbi:hypothetical protein AX16_004691 [Volvariella volvacea WC 439]|nr:hypothetical protein AX16_004691 [Volvariella volvacea WC 439]